MNAPKSKSYVLGSFLVWGALTLVVALIVVFGALKKRPEPVAAEEEKAVAVRTIAIAPRNVQDVLNLPARIEPLQEANLGAERAGRVVEILADKGQAVEAGQPLLRVDDRLWDAARRRAEIEVRDAERDWKRWRELEKTGAVSASESEAVEGSDVQANELADEVEGAVAGAAVESAEVAEEVETAEIAANETVDPTSEAEVSTTEEN